MIIYKVFRCSKCRSIVELQYDEIKKRYTGFCKTCKKTITAPAFGDEQNIKNKFGGRKC